MKFNFFISCLVLFFVAMLLIGNSSCKKKETTLSFTTQTIGDINLKKIKFKNDSVGYCCGGSKNKNGAIYKTINTGAIWTKTFSSTKYCINDIFFLNDSIGFACGDSLTLFKTNNGGDSWTQYTFPNLPWMQYMVPLNSIFFFSEQKGFLAGGEHYGKGSISKTFDSGQIWGHKSYDNEFNCIVFTDQNTGYAGGYGVIYKTTDGGQSFRPCNIRGDWYVSLYFFDNNNGFAAGYDGGIYKTSDGGENWKTIYKGNSLFSSRTHLKQIYFSADNKGYIAGTDGLLLSSDENGNNWKNEGKICDETLNSLCITPNHTIFICSEKGVIYIIKQS